MEQITGSNNDIDSFQAVSRESYPLRLENARKYKRKKD